ncbi:MAG: hypothetical protein ACTSYF_06950 [Promethearchaeota archaeon]
MNYISNLEDIVKFIDNKDFTKLTDTTSRFRPLRFYRTEFYYIWENIIKFERIILDKKNDFDRLPNEIKDDLNILKAQIEESISKNRFNLGVWDKFFRLWKSFKIIKRDKRILKFKSSE